MFLRMVAINSLILSLASAATISYAKPNPLPCPSIDAVQKAAESMNEGVKQKDGSYAVTKAYHIPSIWTEYGGWLVMVSNIIAGSEDEAIMLGKEALEKTSFRKNDAANRSEGLFLCEYGPDDISALAFDDHDSNKAP